MYPNWKYSMTAWLRSNKLMDVVLKPATDKPKRASGAAAVAAVLSPSSSGSTGDADMSNHQDDDTRSAANDVQNAMEAAWRERADRAFGALVQSITGAPTLLTLVQATVEQGDAHGVWSLLEKRCERKTVLSQTHVLQQVTSARMIDGEAMDSYLARVRSLVQMVDGMGESARDALLTHVLLTGLPDEYATVVESIRLERNMAFDDIVANLLDTEERLNMQMRSRTRVGGRYDDVASYAQAPACTNHPQQMNQMRGGGRGYVQQGNAYGGNGSGNRSSSDSRACFTCNQVGHISFDCPRNRDAKKCFTCRRLGHEDHQCPRAGRRRGGNGSRGRGGNHRQQQHHAMAAVTDSTSANTNHAGDGGRDVVFMMAETGEVMTGFVDGETACNAATGAGSRSSQEWILDSAATRHLVNDRTMLTDVQTLTEPILLRLADGKMMELREVGSHRLRQGDSNAGVDGLFLTGVACDERLCCNLLSVPCMTRAGLTVSFADDEAVVRDANGQVLLVVPRKGRLYMLRSDMLTHGHPLLPTTHAAAAVIHAQPSSKESALVASPPVDESTKVKPLTAVTPIVAASAIPAIILKQQQQPNTQEDSDANTNEPTPKPPTPAVVVAKMPAPITPTQLWHLRMGHVSMSGLRMLSRGGALSGLPKRLAGPAEGKAGAIPTAHCSACLIGKAHRARFKRMIDPIHHATKPLQRVHADLCGPIVMPLKESQQQLLRASLNGYEAVYLSAIIDEAMRRVWGRPIKYKSAAADHVKDWLARVERESGEKVVEFHSDGGKEYASLSSFFSARGIQHSITQPYTPQHNGIAERENRTLFEMTRSMLSHARLGPEFWEEAILAAIYVRNRCTTQALIMNQDEEDEAKADTHSPPGVVEWEEAKRFSYPCVG